MAEGEVFFGWLSDQDRRHIRGLRNPQSESISPEERPESLLRVARLLKDSRNISLVEESMPGEFHGFKHKMLTHNPELSSQRIMRIFLLNGVWRYLRTGSTETA